MKPMYRGIPNSPEAVLISAINDTQTSITISDTSIIPELPNLLVIGGDTKNAETVLVTAINGNTITVERGFEGKARSWPENTIVQRAFTAYDYNTLIDNINEIDKIRYAEYELINESHDNIIYLPNSVVNGQINEIIIKGLTLNNQIENGNFRNGTNGFISSTGTLSVNSNKNLVFKASSDIVNNYPNFRTTKQFVIAPNEKIFVYFKARVTNSECDRITLQYTGWTNSIKSINNPEANVWYEFYEIVTNTDTTAKAFYFSPRHVYSSAEVARDKVMEIDGNTGIFLINMTALGIDDLTEDEMLNIVRGGYFEGTKSTLGAIRLKSVGKNLFDFKNKGIKTTDYSVDLGDNYWGLPIQLSPNTTYTVQRFMNGYERDPSFALDLWHQQGQILALNVLSTVDASATFTTDSTGLIYLRHRYATNAKLIKILKQMDIMLQTGTQATGYEPYTESNVYVVAKDEDGNIEELRSLPNGTKDEIRVNGGKAVYIQRIKKYVLQASDIYSLRTDMANIDYVVITLDSDISTSLSIGDVVDIPTMSKGWSTTQDMDNVENIGKWGGWSTTNRQIAIAFAKGTTLEQARQQLVGTELFYQLAEPIEIPVEVFGNLQSYENGTVYVETIIPRVDFYTPEGIYFEEPPEKEPRIKEIDSLYLVNKENGLLTPLDISKAFIFLDGRGFTHPDLFTGALVDWNYVPDVESTNPAISMALPTNLKAQVNNNTSAISKLHKQIDNLNIRTNKNLEAINQELSFHQNAIDELEDYKYSIEPFIQADSNELIIKKSNSSYPYGINVSEDSLALTAKQIFLDEFNLNAHVTRDITYYGTAVRDLSLTGVQTISLPPELGRPRSIIMFGNLFNTQVVCISMGDRTIYSTNDGIWYNTYYRNLVYGENNANRTEGQVTNMRVGAFDINWTHVGNGAEGTARILYLVFFHRED